MAALKYVYSLLTNIHPYICRLELLMQFLVLQEKLLDLMRVWKFV